MERWLILAMVLVALAGCVEEDPGPERATEAAQAEVREPGPLTVTSFDILERFQESGKAELLALQIPADTYFSYEGEDQYSYTRNANNACSMDAVLRDAPVEAMEAWAAGGPEPAGDLGFGAFGFGGGGTGQGTWPAMVVRYEGQDIVDLRNEAATGGGSTEGSRSSSLTYVQDGGWILFVFGMAGIDATSVEGHWTMDIMADRPIEAHWMAPTPLWCGIGFQEHADTDILGLYQEPPDTLRFESTYGAMAVFFQLDDFSGVRFVTPEGSREAIAGERFHTWAKDGFGFDLDPDASAGFWLLLGL